MHYRLFRELQHTIEIYYREEIGDSLKEKKARFFTFENDRRRKRRIENTLLKNNLSKTEICN